MATAPHNPVSTTADIGPTRTWLRNDPAAEYLGLKGQTLRRYRMDGKGPAFHRVGGGKGRILYSLDDLDRWIESHRVDPTA